MISVRTAIALEDDPDIGRIVRFACMKEGVTARIFDNAAEFMAAEISDESVILLDLSLGDENGVEILRFLAGRHCAAPVFLMSGEDERLLNTVRQLGQSYGLDVRGILQKPFRIRDLIKALRTPLSIPERPATRRGDPLAEQLHRAIIGGELLLHFQPKVQISSGSIVGCEALLRWQHPERGLLFPAVFLPAAEEQGLMRQITEWVLQEALAHAATWHAAGHVVSVAVNVPPDMLEDIGLPRMVQSLLRRHNAVGSWLTLEVTEAAAMRSLVSAVDVLSRLRLMRVGLSIDDFGTGHSSIIKLRQLPFKELKIDRSFVQDMMTDPDAKVLVETMVAMARTLGMKTVAEGVESIRELQLLGQIGCEEAQGYYLGRPMASDAFLERLRLDSVELR